MLNYEKFAYSTHMLRWIYIQDSATKATLQLIFSSPKCEHIGEREAKMLYQWQIFFYTWLTNASHDCNRLIEIYVNNNNKQFNLYTKPLHIFEWKLQIQDMCFRHLRSIQRECWPTKNSHYFRNISWKLLKFSVEKGHALRQHGNIINALSMFSVSLQCIWYSIRKHNSAPLCYG